MLFLQGRILPFETSGTVYLKKLLTLPVKNLLDIHKNGLKKTNRRHANNGIPPRGCS